MPKILIPFDGSASSVRALRYVASPAAAMKPSEFLLLNVQHPVPMADLLLDGRPSQMYRLEAPMRQAGEKMLSTAGEVLDKANIAYKSRVEFGEPAQTIVDIAGTHHCELIVMGTRGMGRIKSLLLGSVATKVLHLARIPVLLIR